MKPARSLPLLLALAACAPKPVVKPAPPPPPPVAQAPAPPPPPPVEVSTPTAAVTVSSSAPVGVSTPPAVVSFSTAPVPEPAVAGDANFVLVVREGVSSAAEDSPSSVKVFVDRQPDGETVKGPRSQEKHWGAKLEPGNHLFRFEKWNFDVATGSWTALGAPWQPVERFIRVKDGERATATLRFYDRDRGNALNVERAPLGR